VIGHHALFEIDAAGKLRALVLFDADDRAAAQTELFERYVATGADGMPRGAIEFLRGLNEHDLVRARSGLCDDFVLDDHRRTGLGRLEGAGAYIASVAAAYELAPDLGVAALYTAATATHGRVLLVRAWGTNTEGGAFESIYVALVRYRDAQVAGCEFFEPEHLDEALARFEALRAESR
jgi:GNAT superfamily N-acetyltransferase